MAGGPPDWIGDTLRLAVEDARSYLHTARAFTFHAYRSARDYKRGELEAMNPIGVLATAAVVLGPVRQLAYDVLGIPRPDGFVAMILSALGPFAHYALIGVLVHAVMRVVAPGRPRLADSVAVALYVGGGPAAAAELIAWCCAMAIASSVGAHVGLMLGIVLGAAFAVFCATLASALSALHEASVWMILVAYAVAFTATGLLFGLLHPPGEYGMHWVVSLQRPFLSLGW